MTLLDRLLRRRNRFVASLYDEVVAISRRPVLYAELGVPDTLMGRFNSLSLIMILTLRVLQGRGPALKAMAQELTDIFFAETDRGLRQAGVGDQKLPKTMHKMAGVFYGQLEAYGAALASEGDDARHMALGEVLARNLSEGDADTIRALTDHVLAVEQSLAALDDAVFLSGHAPIPEILGEADEL